jgi:sec-independent protein translocase protein TatB
MFDFDAGKLLIIGIVALIFIPSKDLPRVLRQIGQFVGKMRRMAGEFQSQFMDAMREADMAELKREAEKLAKAAEIDPNYSVSLDPVAPPPLVPAATVEPEHSIAPPALTPPDQADGPLQHEPPLQHHETPSQQHEPKESLESAENTSHPILPPPVHDGA